MCSVCVCVYLYVYIYIYIYMTDFKTPPKNNFSKGSYKSQIHLPQNMHWRKVAEVWRKVTGSFGPVTIGKLNFGRKLRGSYFW